MSKNVVSGAVALLMMVVPVSASALTQVQLPQIPANPTIDQLLTVLANLNAIVISLMSQHDNTIPTVTSSPGPNNCPIFSLPLCTDGQHLVQGVSLPNGCVSAPHCVGNNDDSSSASAVAQITITSPVRGASYTVGDNIPVSWSYYAAPPNSQVILKTENIVPSNPMTGTVSGITWQSPQVANSVGDGVYNMPTGNGTTDFTGTYRITVTLKECSPYGCWYSDPTNTSLRVWATSEPVIITLNPVGATPAISSQTIAYVSHTASSVTAAYANMPPDTQIVLVNQATGQRVDGVSTMITSSGSGTFTMPFPDSMSAGSYFLKAQNYTTGAYIAQTVAFSYAGRQNIACPSTQVPLCPEGGRAVAQQSTQDGNGCQVTRWQCVSTSGPTSQDSTCRTPWGGLTVANGSTLPPRPYFTEEGGGMYGLGQYMRCVQGSWLSCSTSGICTALQSIMQGMNHTSMADDPMAGSVAGVSISLPEEGYTGTCTYFRSGDSDASRSTSVSGGRAACSSWCSAQALQSGARYSCTYNGTQITIAAREAQVASVLSAMQDVVTRIIAWLRPIPAATPIPTATTSTSQKNSIDEPKPTAPMPTVPSGYPYYTPGSTSATAPQVSETVPQPQTTQGATPPKPMYPSAPAAPDNLLHAMYRGTVSSGPRCDTTSGTGDLSG